MELTKEQIDLIGRYFSGQPVIRAFLFGSYVRGEADEESDVDLLVELDYDQMTGGLQFISMQLKLQQLLNRKVDLVSAQGLSRYILPFIEIENGLVYAR
ncbi:MAG: nucleotidyltransferase domain-containing protein [Lewinellaceae bacterium]|nr:nucleotidyltransferase domain-containing protein [Lewinellaceae bacterium]